MAKKPNLVTKNRQTVKDPVISYTDIRKVHPALVQYLGYGLHKVTLGYKQIINSFLESLQLQGHHLSVLHVIRDSREPNQVQIGEELGVDKASMVKVIDHLEKLGLIERVACQKDRRAKILKITPKGIRSLDSALAMRKEVEKKFLRSLSSEEQTVLKSLIKKLVSNMNDD